MRVIGGKAKGHRLKMVPGDTTRPITDRVKENLFNILGNWIIGTRWLDLFAGTGQVGIEALSRNAEHAVFVDSERHAVRTIRANLDHTRLANYATVVQRDAFSYLRKSRSGIVDVIYVAPPQYKGLWKEVMQTVDKQPGSWLTTEGLVIAQIDPVEFEELELENLQLGDQRKYGRTMLCFYEIKSTYSTST
ncbi:MAG: 16S rRNA (guanine(966)-N(2))-methyltransferase RsmD [Candidatus Promineifilaceae bacterium]